MYVGLSKSDLFVGIDYLETTLSAVSASNVASVYALAIHEFLTDWSRSVDQIDLFTQRDLDHIKRWNTPLPPKFNACVHDLVLKHAKSAPQTSALCSWDGDLTYAQLDAVSLRLAKYFALAGIKCETLVPVCFKKSIYAVIAMVAIHRAGGAFVPLDPSHPEDRLKVILDKAKAKLVIASPETAGLFKRIDVSIIQVCSSMVQSLPSCCDTRIPKVQPDNAAFVLFTSGSTGEPKGIVQEHASVCTSSLAHGRAMNVHSDSRVFQYAAFTFDVSMMDIFTTLIYGGCVCIPSEEDRMGSFTSVMNRMKVNWVLFTPSVASLITPEDVPTLQNLALGGEAVKQENLGRWLGKVRLFNCYGPAECAACSIGEYDQIDSRPGNIGRQFGGGLNWVVDPSNHNRLVPVGVVGELAVEGPTLARGYLGDIAKTKAAFIKSPPWQRGVGLNKPRRLYKTGDLVRQNSDGTFEFAGRKDHQLKVRGQRVELGEVEFVLSTFAGIALAVAAMPQSGPYSNVLVGVIQLNQQSGVPHSQSPQLDCLSRDNLVAMNFDKEKLSHFLKSKIPPYMVPTHLLFVNKLPLSVSGKIDRKVVDAWLVRTPRIYEPEITQNGQHEDTLPTDNIIALRVCSKILSMVAQPGDVFFDSLNGSNFSMAAVGLDSIQVINLTMFIRHQYGVKIQLETLVNPASTVRNIASSITNLLAGVPDLTSESKFNIMDQFRKYRREALDGLNQAERGSQNVMVTGATGYLGTRILHQLCRNSNVSKIIVHVRSYDREHALRRTVQSAKLAGWWKEHYLGKLEAWAGELAKPRLGLSADQWRRLCGYGLPSQRITAIIHNGAAVNWQASFSSLKATNVDSTVGLLQAATHSAALTDFVYVSGGQRLRLGEDNDMEIAEEVVQSNGYAQTKFLSELLVKEYARHTASSQQRVSVVKTGYMIGTMGEGIANTDDFIWRLTATCIDIKAYNATSGNPWLFVSDVDRIATAVSDCCQLYTQTAPSKTANIVKVLDGITASDFWRILEQELGYEIHLCSPESWMERFYKDIEAKGETHQLWPLLQTIEERQGELGAPCDPQEIANMDEQRIKATVKKNVEYLSSIGFLPKPNGEKIPLEGKVNGRFTRPLHLEVKEVMVAPSVGAGTAEADVTHRNRCI